MSPNSSLEMGELSLTSPAPTYSSNLDMSNNDSTESREQLLPRKAAFAEAVDPPKVDVLQFHEAGLPVGHSFPRGYEHVQEYENQGKLWLPGFWQQFPWKIILPLVGCLACLAGAIAILVRSDGEPVAQWSVTPTVWLAVLATILNMSLRYAFKQAAAISWWRKAVRGSTVTDLHKHWSSADGFFSALGAGRHFRLISLGSIAATLVVIDQPLIQRASTIVSVPRTQLTNITAVIAPEIPWGYTGYQSGRDQEQQLLTEPMISAFNDHNTQAPMTSGFTGCEGFCTGYVEAGGLAAQCRTVTGPVQYLQPIVFDVSGGPEGVPPSEFVFDSPFNVNFTLQASNGTADSTQIWMVVAYTRAPTGDCAGIRTQRTCSLRPATLRYPITIQNGTLSFGNLTNDATVQSIQPGSNSTNFGIDGGGDYTYWTLGGIYAAAQNLFNSNASYAFEGGIGNQIVLADTLSNQYLDTTSYGTGLPTNFTELSTRLPRPCNSSWTDPTNHILTSLNQIAFRVSLEASNFPYRNTNDTPPPQIITMLETSNVNVFHSEHKYMIAMIILTTVFMGLVVPSFTGWWNLGRRVTLDPIEIAKAFDAPMFQGPGSNAPLRQLVQTYGARSVMYGEVEGHDEGTTLKRRLKLGNPEELMRPTFGTCYD